MRADPGNPPAITGILDRVRGGDLAALDELFPLLYAELRAMADREMRGEGEYHTLQPTALVNETYLGPGAEPHWLALEPNTHRLVLTGYGTLQHRVLMLRFDSTTGALSVDSLFREPGAATPGFLLTGKTWPHGGSAPGRAHGAVFGKAGN